jgi:hypothetical protein
VSRARRAKLHGGRAAGTGAAKPKSVSPHAAAARSAASPRNKVPPPPFFLQVGSLPTPRFPQTAATACSRRRGFRSGATLPCSRGRSRWASRAAGRACLGGRGLGSELRGLVFVCALFIQRGREKSAEGAYLEIRSSPKH